MDRAPILQGIRDHLVNRGLDGAKITEEADLAGDLDLDSLDTVELTLGMEKRFEVEIPDSELEDLATVGDAIDLIAAKLAARV